VRFADDFRTVPGTQLYALDRVNGDSLRERKIMRRFSHRPFPDADNAAVIHVYPFAVRILVIVSRRASCDPEIAGFEVSLVGARIAAYRCACRLTSASMLEDI